MNATITNALLSALIANPATNSILNRNIDRLENQPFNLTLCTNGARTEYKVETLMAILDETNSETPYLDS